MKTTGCWKVFRTFEFIYFFHRFKEFLWWFFFGYFKISWLINVITFFLLILVRRLIFQQILKYCPMKVLIHRLLINLTLFQAGGLFGQPPTSIRHDFFLVIAMELKFSIASQLVIRKILPKYLKKNMCHYGIMTSFWKAVRCVSIGVYTLWL